MAKKRVVSDALEKAPTGIRGLDEITNGGLPKGRPTLIAGGPGSGKTLMAMEFLVHGAQDYNEPGVFIAFEETAEDLAKNVKSLGFDLAALSAAGKLSVDYVYIERSEIEETGEYDLDGLFVRLGYAIDSIKAKRVVLDTIEVLFASFQNESILRAELRRLFRWLKEKGVTAVITGERGTGTVTRHGLEEYVADCVIVLDHRLTNELSTRRVRIVKYRGSSHGTNEYPFLIGDRGISVLPITSLGLRHTTTKERISSGVPRLDAMLSGKGFYRGSTVLLSGTAGTGKSSFAAAFAKAACERNERVLYFAFEESQSQIVRNMQSIGFDLQHCLDKGLLRFEAARPTVHGLEMHLTDMHDRIESFLPGVVILDPITNLISIGSDQEVKSMLTRLIDFLKSKTITALVTSLTPGGSELERTEIGISSLMDTWMILRDVEFNGERNRLLTILKSRGMAHSNQTREFFLTDKGIQMRDVYLGPSGVLVGSARAQQEAEERAREAERAGDLERKRREIDRKRAVAQARIAVINAEIEAEEEEMARVAGQEAKHMETAGEERREMARRRHAEEEVDGNDTRRKKTARRKV